MPQFAAGIAIEGQYRTICQQHEYALTCHHWCGVALCRQALAPEFFACGKYQQVVVLRHGGQARSVKTWGADQGRAETVAADDLAIGVEGQHFTSGIANQ